MYIAVDDLVSMKICQTTRNLPKLRNDVRPCMNRSIITYKSFGIICRLVVAGVNICEQRPVCHPWGDHTQGVSIYKRLGVDADKGKDIRMGQLSPYKSFLEESLSR
jgi:hypothetical protein